MNTTNPLRRKRVLIVGARYWRSSGAMPGTHGRRAHYGLQVSSQAVKWLQMNVTRLSDIEKLNYYIGGPSFG